MSLILGGTGFIGKELCSCLSKRQLPYQIVSKRAHPGAVSIDIGQEGAETSLKPLVQQSTAIYHLVGLLQADPKTFENVQLRGMERLLMAAEGSSCRILYVSAIGADSQSDIPYARTKGLAEKLLLSERPNSIIVRPSLVFGPGDGFFNRFSTLANYLPVMPVFGGGQSKFQPIYVKDLVQIMIKAMDSPETRGKIIEAGGPKIYTYRELMALTLSESGKKRPIISLPWEWAMMQAFVLEQLPPNLFSLTRDQVKLLKQDNIVSGKHWTAEHLNVPLTSAESVLHEYLK